MLGVLVVSSCATSQDDTSGSELAPKTVETPVEQTEEESAESLVPDEPTVHLQLPDEARQGLSPLEIDQDGSAAVDVAVATMNGGGVITEAGPSGGTAFEFPAYDDPSLGRRAVIRVVNAGREDLLEPEGADFEFGAEFRRDDISTGDRTDNGDNLIQRGLFGDGAQYKIDIDKETPACRIEGADGVIQVRASIEVLPGKWYAVRCARRGAEVELTVMEYAAGGWSRRSVDSQSGAIGTISWDEPELPLSVGGKLTRVGEVVERASDQFNGAIANPYLSIEQ